MAIHWAVKTGSHGAKAPYADLLPSIAKKPSAGLGAIAQAKKLEQGPTGKCRMVFDVLAAGESLTVMESFKCLGHTALTSSIWRLRNWYLVPIVTTMIVEQHADGTMTRYGRYRIPPDALAEIQARYATH